MAVSFKVPASPKRSIFNIDSFEGVDFTNTETSVDDNKSPDAENMVRLVPGKVRKRTGYKTRVLFSDGTDVNRVIGSSEKFVDIDVENMGDTLQTGTVLAQFYDLFPSNTSIYSCFIMSYRGSYQFDYDNGQIEATSTTPNVWHVSGHRDKYTLWSNRPAGLNVETKDLRVFRDAPYEEGDYLQIKKIIVCTKISANNVEKTPWSLAPEERGAMYVKRDSISPVFGCHILKTYDANRVVNVNRAQNTSDTFESFTVTDTAYEPIAQLGEAIYRSPDASIRTMMYVEFDYISDAQCKVSVGGWEYTTTHFLEDTSGATVHYSMNIGAGDYAESELSLKCLSGTANVQVKNISVMYQKNNDYAWSQAPEDNGGIFHIEDVYTSLPNNYATTKSYYYSGESTSLNAIANITVGNASSNVLGFAHVSFDIETSTSEELSKVIVRTISSSAATVTEEEFTENLTKHFDYYLGTGASSRYIQTIQVEFQLANDDATCLALVKNISIKQIQPRPDYNIFAKDYLYHVGSDIYLYTSADEKIEKIYSSANQAKSQSWQLNDKLVVLDGKTVFLYDFEKGLQPISSGIGYIPLIKIAGKAGTTPGGQSYEALNLIQPKFIEQFMVDKSEKTTATDFYLSFQKLDSPFQKVEIMDTNGNWVTKTDGVDYYFYWSTGRVHFLSAPFANYSDSSGIWGQDNVRITASRTVDGYADRINKCTIGTLFGVGGAADRLFLSGNPDHPNWDFFSQDRDPTYFPDTGYAVLGSASSAIVGYAIVNNYLAAFKDEFDQAQNVIIREGDLIIDSDTKTSEPAFKIINTLQGGGAIAPYSFAYLQTEPLFLTRSGIYAITPQDITGERYSQNRSFYLNGKLLKEEDLESAVATVFDDQYILAINQKLYILDGLQPMRTDKSMPYATRQYAGFYCTNVPAACIWTDEQALWVGTYDGKVCRFDKDIESLDSYNDDGKAIECHWDTPDLDGRLFYKNKTFRYFAIRTMNALRTSCGLYYKKPSIVIDENGDEVQKAWTLIKEDAATGSIFDFNYIDFARFSFNTDTTAKVVHTKVRVKKVDKMQFRIENNAKDEPFGLFDLALEYVESGNYKG